MIDIARQEPYLGFMNVRPKQYLSISLTPEEAALLEDAVARGEYASRDEIVSEAIRLWGEHKHVLSREADRLKQAYNEGMASGEGKAVDPAAFLKELKASFRAV